MVAPKAKRFWRWYAIVAIAILMSLNVYLLWLHTMVVPVKIPVDLVRTGASQERHVSGFYNDAYGVCLGIDIPGVQGEWFRRMEEIEPRVRSDMDVSLAIEIRDASGSEVYRASGSVADWTLTSATYIPATDATLYTKPFTAALWQHYRIRVVTERGKASSAAYRPVLFFHGVDDGYFYLGWFVYNILTFALIGGIAVVPLVVQLWRGML